MGRMMIVAGGIFLGQWLVIPLLDKGRSFSEGFRIGMFSAVSVLMVSWLLYAFGLVT